MTFPGSTAHFAVLRAWPGRPGSRVGPGRQVERGPARCNRRACCRPEIQAEDEEAIQVAVVGRPNVGKSSLDQSAARRGAPSWWRQNRVRPGTAIDSPLRYHGKTLNFIDTAGLRRRAKVEDDLEFYSTLRTHRAIERADVCVLVVDAAVGLHAQDLRIATEAWDRGCGLIVVVNKWDLIPEKDANTAKRGAGPAGREGSVPQLRARSSTPRPRPGSG